VTDRSKLAKCIAMLGSDAAGERANALAAADRELAAAGMSWIDIACLAERMDVPDSVREQALSDVKSVLTKLLRDQLNDALVAAAWTMQPGEAGFLRKIIAECESGTVNATGADMQRAIDIADQARRHANPFPREQVKRVSA
jgi:hypothetical protein